MAQKIKKNFSRRNQEKLRRALRRFDWSAIMLAATIIISGLWCLGKSYNLGEASYCGFVYWFLLVLSYPVLLIASIVSMIPGVQINFIADNEATVLSCAALLLLVAVWAMLRQSGKSRNSIAFLRISGNFMRMVAAWGVFQFICGITLLVWQSGEFAKPLHRHFVKQQVQQNFVQSADTASEKL
jgi:hypothetical protein